MEKTLHYIWKHKLFQKNLSLTDGTSIEILDVGIHNPDQGPDFFNAKIKVNGECWAGNIEIHKTSADWYTHKHHKDLHYDSVVLHVVSKADREIMNSKGRLIPQCEIVYSNQVQENIDFLLNADVSVPCCNYLRDIPQMFLTGWINALLLERLERKATDLDCFYNASNGSWAEVFYIILSRSMGFGLNSDAFEQLAKSLPLSYILKQADKLIQIEALLFGQAGLLSDLPDTDEYVANLKREYNFLQNKYSLIPLPPSIFRMMRVRPASSPILRIAQLAVLLQNIQGLWSKILSSKDVGQIRLLLHVNASEYWQTHYVFGEVSAKKNKYIGDSSLNVMIINAVVPMLFLYGKKIGDESFIDKAMAYLEEIPAESNSIITQFSKAGLICKCAYDSQALIQLKREYCEKRKCLYCRIGYKIVSSV